MTPPLVWFLCSGTLVLLALLGVDSDGLLLMAGLAGLLITLLTIAVPLPPSVTLLLFLALGGSGYGLLRRWDRQQRERQLPPTPGAESAVVISGFSADGQGRVRWQGQSWAAENLAPETALSPGAEVTVMGREGTSLQVLPR
jgi:hypothetical protein